MNTVANVIRCVVLFTSFFVFFFLYLAWALCLLNLFSFLHKTNEQKWFYTSLQQISQISNWAQPYQLASRTFFFVLLYWNFYLLIRSLLIFFWLVSLQYLIVLRILLPTQMCQNLYELLMNRNSYRLRNILPLLHYTSTFSTHCP